MAEIVDLGDYRSYVCILFQTLMVGGHILIWKGILTFPPTTANKEEEKRGGSENSDHIREYFRRQRVWRDWNSLSQSIVVLPRQTHSVRVRGI
jgi:hypothetical protein